MVFCQLKAQINKEETKLGKNGPSSLAWYRGNRHLFNLSPDQFLHKPLQLLKWCMILIKVKSTNRENLIQDQESITKSSFFQEPLLILQLTPFHNFGISMHRGIFLHRIQCYNLTKILEPVVYRNKCRKKGWLYRSS